MGLWDSCLRLRGTVGPHGHLDHSVPVCDALGSHSNFRKVSFKEVWGTQVSKKPINFGTGSMVFSCLHRIRLG